MTVSLTQGAGYKLGAQTAAGLMIGPPPGQTTASTTGQVHHGVLTALRPHVTTPELQIQSVDADVSEGTPASFVITASVASIADVTVNLDSGGTANNNDIVAPPSSVVLPANATTVTVSVPTRVDNVVKPSKTLILSLAPRNVGYTTIRSEIRSPRRPR